MNTNRIGTIRQLEILQAVYQHNSISKAAEALKLTQPTLSTQLKKLAVQNDVRLYDQVGKKIVFTEAGRLFLDSASEILREVDRLQTNLSELNGLTKGTLKLAVVTSAKYFIPHLLGPFCEKYPGIEVQLKVGNREQVIQRLEEAEDDFYVFSHVPDLPQISSKEFLPNPLIAISAPEHPLAKKKNIKLSELCQYDFLSREAGSGTRRSIELFFAKQDQKLKTKMTIESNEAIRHCVMVNLGFSILSSHALSFGGDEGIVMLDVQNMPIPSSWSFVWPNEKALSPIANVFLRYTQNEGTGVILSPFAN